MSACSQFCVLIGEWRFAGKLTHMVADASVRHAQANQQWFLCVFCTCLSMLLISCIFVIQDAHNLKLF